MDARDGAQLAEIQRLRDSAWEVIGTATVDGSDRHRYWKVQQTHCGLHQDTTGKIHAPHILTGRLLTFAVAVREGQYGNGHKVQGQLVKFTLRAVAQKYVLDGYPNPRRASPAQHSLDLPIARLLKKYGNEDPPPEPKLAVPISTITGIAENIGGPPILARSRIWSSLHFFTSFESENIHHLPLHGRNGPSRCGTVIFVCGLVMGTSSHTQQGWRCYYKQIAQQYALCTQRMEQKGQ